MRQLLFLSGCYLDPFVYGLVVIISQYLAAIGFPRELIAVWLVALCVLLLSGWLLIPNYGGQGAAMSLSLAYFLLLGMIWQLSNKQMRINKRESSVDY